MPSQPRPKWRYNGSGLWINTELDSVHESELREILGGRDPGSIEAFIRGCRNAFVWFQVDNHKAEMPVPSMAEKSAAMLAIDRDTENLWRKLDRCGGARMHIAAALVEQGEPVEAIEHIQAMLCTLSSAIHSARLSIDQERAQDSPRNPPYRDMLALRIADAFYQRLGEWPQAKTEREHSATHPYVQTLRVMFEQCTGRTEPLTAIEHRARSGINLLKQHIDRRATK